jgi:hypothetical protein
MLPEGRDPEAFKAQLAAAVPDTAVRIATYAQAQPGLRRLDQFTMYLGLRLSRPGGGIGVAVSVRASSGEAQHDRRPRPRDLPQVPPSTLQTTLQDGGMLGAALAAPRS